MNRQMKNSVVPHRPRLRAAMLLALAAALAPSLSACGQKGPLTQPKAPAAAAAAAAASGSSR